MVDPAGSVVPGAPVQLTNQGTAAALTATTDSQGLFRFPNLSPAIYSVTVQAKGFKTRVERDITVGLSENRDVGRLGLEIGNVGESITVTAEATPVQTSSSERSQVIDGNQLNSEVIRGREMMSFMRMLPGVVDTTVARDATGGSVLGGLTFNGSTGITGFMEPVSVRGYRPLFLESGDERSTDSSRHARRFFVWPSSGGFSLCLSLNGRGLHGISGRPANRISRGGAATGPRRET